MNLLKEIVQSISDVLFPRQCIFCSAVLEKNEKHICNKCKKLYPYPEVSMTNDFFITFAPYIERIFILSWYSITRKVVREFKFNEAFYNGEILCNLFAQSLEQLSWIKDIDYIVPVPLAKKKLRKRGFNQCDIIADILSKRLNIPTNKTNLIKRFDTKEQHSLTIKERYDNLVGAFDIKDKHVFENKTILLIDDVLTSGTTLIQCSKALKQTQNIKIFCACLSSDRGFMLNFVSSK